MTEMERKAGSGRVMFSGGLLHATLSGGVRMVTVAHAVASLVCASNILRTFLLPDKERDVSYGVSAPQLSCGSLFAPCLLLSNSGHPPCRACLCPWNALRVTIDCHSGHASAQGQESFPIYQT